MKLSYRISLLFLVSIFLFTFSNSYADSDMLSVTSKFYGNASSSNTIGDGSYTITATDVFMAGGSSYGGSFHLYASYNVYDPNIVPSSVHWILDVYVNNVVVLHRSFYYSTGDLDEYVTAKAGDIVRITVRPDILTGKTSTSQTARMETTVHFGII